MTCSQQGKFVAIVVEGKQQVHAQDVNGNYATLCGLDGADPQVGQYVGELPKRPKIDCNDCIAIISVAKTYKESELKCVADV